MRHALDPSRAQRTERLPCGPAPLRAALLAGVVAGVLAPGLAVAAPKLKGPPPPPPVDDGLGPRDAYMEAETMVDNRASGVVTARGHVEARTGGRTIRADEVVYNRQTGAAHAHGHVTIVNADGTVQYAEDVDLDQDMRAGLAVGFAARLQQNVTIAAGAALRRTEEVQQLNNAIFTPCNICKADGVTPKTPTWSIQASRIIQDRAHSVIYYKHAIIRVKNIPVMYFPIFWTPDPSAERRSGFLVPRVEYAKRRGFSYEQPYYWAISPYADLTVAPQLNTRVNPFVDLHYRERFYSGAIDIRTGYTYERNFTSKLFYDNPTSRSYVLGTGKFDINKNWIWGFGLERVTDPTFFRRYSVRDIFFDRGPFPTDTDRLISQLYTQRQDSQSFVSAAALSFQSIRAYGQDPVTGAITGESSRYFPTVAPLIEARWDPKTSILGGRIRGELNAVSLNRNNAATELIDPSNQLLPAGPLQNPALVPILAPGAQTLSWTDSRRVSGQLDWRTDLTVGPGVRISPFAQGRQDLYFIGQSSAKGGKDDFVARTLGTVGTDISWPLYRTFGSNSVIVEPIAQLAVSPLVKPSDRIPNEDSVSFTFDESNLFSTNRFSGFDLYEGGARLNTGVRTNAFFGNGGRASVIVGRSFRTEEDPAFLPQSGLRGTASDWIVYASYAPNPRFSVFSRSRLDADTGAIHSEDAGIQVSRGWINGNARYLYSESGLVVAPTGTVTVGKTQTLDVNGEIRPLKNWGFSIGATRDLETELWPRAQLGVFYQDECIRVDVLYTHDEYIGQIDSSDSVAIRLTLATLGDTTPRRPSRGSR